MIAEADAIVRVRLAAPDLQPYLAYITAALYVSRQSRGAPTTDLDAWIAMKPWLKTNRDTYRWVVERGFVAPAPVSLVGTRLRGGIAEPADMEPYESLEGAPGATTTEE